MNRRIPEYLANFFYRHPVLLVVFVILYFISPVDILPEALVGVVGFIDDILIVAASIYLRRLGLQKHVDTTAEKQD